MASVERLNVQFSCPSKQGNPVVSELQGCFPKEAIAFALSPGLQRMVEKIVTWFMHSLPARITPLGFSPLIARSPDSARASASNVTPIRRPSWARHVTSARNACRIRVYLQDEANFIRWRYQTVVKALSHGGPGSREDWFGHTEQDY